MKTFNLRNAGVVALLVLALPVAHANDWTGNVGGSIGSKHLDNKDWSSLDSQGAAGFMLDIKGASWPVRVFWLNPINHSGTFRSPNLVLTDY